MSEHIPRTQSRSDPMDPARAMALAATLGAATEVAMGDALPPFAHHIYFWDALPPDGLGRDGHPARGGLIPDLGLPRRMWAAGKLVFHRPLLAGIRAEKTSTLEAVTRKTGRTGPLAFVRLRHEIRQRQTLAVSEWQELVYREDQPAATPPPIAATDEDFAQDVTFDSTMLFRYSALTFNGHRIHYDQDYARTVEGYDGLVVHGPLLAHLLMDMATSQRRTPMQGFSYRATAPLLHHETATLCWNNGRAWVRGPDGRQCMTAEAH